MNKPDKVNKKGVFLSLTMDMWGWLILFIGVLLWSIIFIPARQDLVINVDQDAKSINDNEIFLNILKTPVGGSVVISDKLITISSSNRDAEVIDTIDVILNLLYAKEKKVCWKLQLKDKVEYKELLEKGCENPEFSEQPLFDSELSVPSLYSSKIKTTNFRLTVLGYDRNRINSDYKPPGIK